MRDKLKLYFMISLFIYGSISGLFAIIGSIFHIFIDIFISSSSEFKYDNTRDFTMFLSCFSILFILDELEEIRNNTKTK